MTTRRLIPLASLESIVERVDQQRPGELPRDTVATGFPSVDRILGGGIRRRDLVVLGGDIGAGKSALALGIALRVAQQNQTVGFWSGEMDERRLMERALAIEGRVAVDELRGARLSDQARASVGAAAVRLRNLRLSVRALGAPDLDMAAELDAARGQTLVVVDYLQVVPPPAGTRPASQDEEAALAIRHLKALALEHDVALLVVAQLPRFDATRTNPRPTLDDFGGLGAIKQHADVVLTIFREEMYRPGGGVEGATELAAVKNRNGPTGFIDLYFYRRWMRFEDMLDPDR
ncbi:MAG TPA: DnaB-like helicase C-terminal domain-containing protein [Gemmatimonadales bacterium]|nr:DnaB-like helicase C-terminal domain-containing protein [Gemmatimonadales bacterium]